ncbi:Gfo/Idh/MocA family oxidoreductase [Paenibacillus dauci]|uniref:Gfo/Idh/MocA family oxidoreductase n=1 Tax=Paenibacillus dauci TaxID=1567106 RepID=UPI000619E547|nr:Gfo/Idh/MocA family oxidoreductase [Paenibacillus dauci]
MTLRIGVIGTGAIGQDHIHRISNNLHRGHIVAVTDVNLEQAQRTASQLNEPARIFADGYQLIASPDVDAILVASWGPTHEEFVLASIAAGKPVFCEKPLAVTAEGCMRIMDAEMAYGRPLVQVGYMRRYDRSYRQLKQVLDEGRIGETLLVHAAHRAPSAPGCTGDMAITDSHVHEIDVLRWLLDDDYISAQVIQPRSTRLAAKGLQDPIIVLLETRKGIRIDTEIFVNCQYGYDIQCQIVGEKGIAHLPEPSSVQMRSDARLSTEILTDWKDRFADAYDVELQEWIDASLQNEVYGPTAWDGYVAAVTADACVKAKYSGLIEPIHLREKPAFYNRNRMFA